MASVDETRRAGGQSGAQADGQTGSKKSDWQKQLEMLSLASLARGASPSTMAGFALGKFLSNWFDRRAEKKRAEQDAKGLQNLEGNDNSTDGTTSKPSYEVGMKLNGVTDPYYMSDPRLTNDKVTESITFGRGQDTGGSVVDGTTSKPSYSGFSELGNYMRGSDNFNIARDLGSTYGSGRANDLATIGNQGEFGYNTATGKMEYEPIQKGLLLSQSDIRYPSEEKVQGMLFKGNINPYNRPVVRNEDGSISTVESMSFSPGDGLGAGKEVLVPTISDDGRRLTDEEAQQYYYYDPKGARYLGIFDTPENADRYAINFHNKQDEYYNRRK